MGNWGIVYTSIKCGRVNVNYGVPVYDLFPHTVVFIMLNLCLQIWPETTDPSKFVYEDVAIAAYLMVSSSMHWCLQIYILTSFASSLLFLAPLCIPVSLWPQILNLTGLFVAVVILGKFYIIKNCHFILSLGNKGETGQIIDAPILVFMRTCSFSSCPQCKAK